MEYAVFRATKGVADYHTEMNAPRFEKWFTERFLTNIEQHSVIVMDNASYHGVQLEKAPSSSSLKASIQSWLTEKKKAFRFPTTS